MSSRWRFGGLRRFWCAEHRGLAEGGGLADHDAQDNTTVGRLLGAASGRWCPHCERFDPNALAFITDLLPSHFFELEALLVTGSCIDPGASRREQHPT